jgi:hypothetical protein
VAETSPFPGGKGSAHALATSELQRLFWLEGGKGEDREKRKRPQDGKKVSRHNLG